MIFKRHFKDKVFCAFDLIEDKAVLIAAQKRTSRDFELLAITETQAEGFENSQIIKISDAAETVWRLKKQLMSQLETDRLQMAFVFQAPIMTNELIKGTKIMSSDGMIRKQDVNACLESAYRTAQNFDRHIFYNKPETYVIDEKDWVIKPEGIFAAKLEVQLRAFSCSYDAIDRWQQTLKRLFIEDYQLYHRANAVYQGISGYQAFEQRLKIWDWQADWVTVIESQSNVIRSIGVFASGDQEQLIKELRGNLSTSTHDSLLLTGAMAQDIDHKKYIESSLGLESLEVGLPQGFTGELKTPKMIALCGALWMLASKNESKQDPVSWASAGKIKSKFEQLVAEYF